jgi:D-3-phosphoglycerate dehydrogenase
MTPAQGNGNIRVIVADPIDAAAVKLLSGEFEVVDVSKTPEKLSEVMPEASAILVRSRTKVNKALIDQGQKLKVIGRAGVGVDNVDLVAAGQRGIVVVNAPAAASTSVAELTVGLLVAVARNFSNHVPSMKQGKWTKGGQGLELLGRTVGFVGYGRIAREVAIRLKGFGMKVQAYDPFLTSTPDGTPLISLDELLKTSDVVSLHANATEANRHMINRDALSKMKKGAIIVNVARGALIDEQALLDALDAGQLAGVALDVFEEEPPKNPKLLAHPLIVATPHIGALTREAQERAGMVVARDVIKVLKGEKPEFPVRAQ